MSITQTVSLRSRLFLSGTDSDAPCLARQYGCGYEITAFCYAPNLEDVSLRSAVRAETDGISSFWLHAPFAELIPCSVDPRVRAVVRERCLQTISVAVQLGVRRLVFHGGYIPLVYFPEWYIEQSICFWRDLLPQLPPDLTIALENVMEPSPDSLVAIVRGIDDPRFGLCLDVGHANTVVSQTPPLDWLEPMRPYLRHVHLHDNHGHLDEHLPLGDGSMPIPALLDALSALPDVTITLENQSVAPSLQYLSAHGYL